MSCEPESNWTGATGEAKLLPALETLVTSSSSRDGAEGKRSSSDRKEEARGSVQEASERAERRGHDGKAQVSERMVEGEMSMGDVVADVMGEEGREL